MGSCASLLLNGAITCLGLIINCYKDLAHNKIGINSNRMTMGDLCKARNYG